MSVETIDLTEMQVVTDALERRQAEMELTEVFGGQPDPASIEAWLTATDRAKRRSARIYDAWIAAGDPAWKARR